MFCCPISSIRDTGKHLRPVIQSFFPWAGLTDVDIAPLLQFDYAALGHLHRAQQAGEPFIRYCGTLLKYSVSEAGDTKSLHAEWNLAKKGRRR